MERRYGPCAVSTVCIYASPYANLFRADLFRADPTQETRYLALVRPTHYTPYWPSASNTVLPHTSTFPIQYNHIARTKTNGDASITITAYGKCRCLQSSRQCPAVRGGIVVMTVVSVAGPPTPGSGPPPPRCSKLEAVSPRN